MYMNMEFSVLYKDETVADIKITDGNVGCKRYTDIVYKQPFIRDYITIMDVYKFFESRCYENGRADLELILSEAGLKNNSPWDWVKLTHGVTYEDFLWIKFKDEKLEWKDVRLR